ncbi:MAG: group II intron reverse transcriptase/maturase [Chloroflexi bacterium]|nr:MAG: group II intron reverse transcriptase/maturase [Chloroflexota bacterium]RPI81870.1 MAG: group II intron reverse transcriptase/maturase [Chloroflexota bacterium]
MRSQIVSTKLQQIAEQAVNEPDKVFTNIMYLVDVDFLREAYQRTRKDAAPGMDGVTAEQYAKNLDENLQALYDRMRKGQYRAPAVKRIWLDKENGSKRPIGIPEFEDKIVQRAVSMLLGAIYEQDFYAFSHGFRPEHSPHQALGEIWKQCMGMNIGWIIDADVSGFFDNLSHSKLQEIIKQRVNDGGILRYIGKWLNAGIMDGESLSYPEKGTPQGGVVSPILANVYLHHVLDEWFVKEVQPLMKGRCFLCRFADDFIIGFEREEDARRVMEVLPKRFARFDLTIHPEKTRLVSFQKPNRQQEDGKGNGTFVFLGFTHYWAKSRRNNWVIKRKTAPKRLHRSMRNAWEWCRQNRHKPLREQYHMLCLKLNGHYQYYGIQGNFAMLRVLYKHVENAWRYWLSHRSSKGGIPWEMFRTLGIRYPLPTPRIVHCV